ncbi:MAG TPA: hypothetical protein VHV79_04000 [Mycobacteriales bacterium]|nr:hypothetical protein [Mycobacteriales bacterium]
MLCVAGAAAASQSAGAASPATGLSQSVLTAAGSPTGAGLGESIAVSGHTIVVGAYEQTLANNNEQGAVYVFTRPASGWKNAMPTAELHVSDGQPNDRFGYSVAISGDTIVVGAPQHSVGSTIKQGAAYVFRKPASGWQNTAHPTAVLTSDNGASDDNFAGAVAIAGSTIVVGAYSHQVGGNTEQGEAYVYSEPKAGWQTTAITTTDLVSADGAAVDLFGAAVAISGNTIVVGAPNHSGQAGLVYLFLKPPTGWAGAAATRTLVGADTAAGDEFGHSVAITGNTVAVGAPGFHGGVGEGEGAAYVFQRPAPGWGLPGDPPLVANAELTSTGTAAPALLGQGVAISGAEVLAGAPERTVGPHIGQGAVEVFRRTGTAWTSQTQAATLVAQGGGPADYLGTSVAVDGTTIAAGAPGRANSTGAAYLFTPPGPGLVQAAADAQVMVARTRRGQNQPATQAETG